MLNSVGRPAPDDDGLPTGTPAQARVRASRARTDDVDRQSAARSAADRHSKRVRRLRIILPLLGAVIVLGLAGRFAWSVFSSRLGLANVLFSKDGVTMVEPHLSGRSNGRSYEVNAARAFQAFDDPKKVRMEEVRARMEMTDKRWATVDSPRGGFDGIGQNFNFEGGVTAITSDGYRITLDQAAMDTDKGGMSGSGNVRVLASGMTIAADKVSIEDHGVRIHFESRVVVTIDAKSDKTADKTTDKTDDKTTGSTPKP